MSACWSASAPVRPRPSCSAPRPPERQQSISWASYGATAAVVALCGLVGWLSHSWQHREANIVMVFLLGVAYVAARYGRGPSIAAAVASVLVFDFFFTEPYL